MSLSRGKFINRDRDALTSALPFSSVPFPGDRPMLCYVFVHSDPHSHEPMQQSSAAAIRVRITNIRHTRCVPRWVRVLAPLHRDRVTRNPHDAQRAVISHFSEISKIGRTWKFPR